MRILATLLFISCVGFIQGLCQGPVIVTGTVTNDQGNTVPDVEIFITASFSDSTTHFSVVTTDQNGVYSDMFTPPDSDTSGVVMVDMIDCNGTIFQVIGTWGPNVSTINIDLVFCGGGLTDTCGVVIIQDINPNGAVGLFALSFSDVPASYLWSTGDTTPFIVPPHPGTYCVTIADDAGCTATDCFEFVGDTLLCDVMVIPGGTGTNAGLTAVGIGVPPFSYAWNTGETTQTILPSGGGEYCVTLTDFTGCAATACYVIDSTFCEVWIACDPPGLLTAMAFGHEPISYLWNTGDTTQSISPAEEGEYCVTVTDATGCTVSSCAYHVPIDFCETILFYGADSTAGTPTQLIAFSLGVPPFDYVWSTGDTTDHIVIDSLVPGICVTVTDATGCVDTACTDELLNHCWSWISVEYTAAGTAELTAFGDAVANGNVHTYEWSTGEVSQSISVQHAGEYCVTVTNTNGCVATACVYVDFDFHVDSCFVVVLGYQNPADSLFSVEAIAHGTAPFTYTWSDGQTGPVIHVTDLSNDLCVTVTDANGCEAVGCYTHVDHPWCDVLIDLHHTDHPGIIELVAVVPETGASWEFIWDTGDTGHAITVDLTGEYCVTATAVSPDGTTCTASACIFVNVNDSTGTGFPVQGYIFGDGFHTFTGVVELYELNPNSGTVLDTWTLMDSAVLANDSFYLFDEVPAGLYSVKFVPDPNTAAAEAFFPTYHYSAVEWNDADIVFVPNVLNITTDIHLVSQTDTNGIGIIAGTLMDDDGLLPEPSSHLRSSLEGIQINLTSSQSSVLRYVLTNEHGEFRFENLPWGTYKLRYEVAGIASPELWVTIGPDRVQASGLVMNTSDLVSTTREVIDEQSLLLWPHPVSEILRLRLETRDTRQYDMQILSSTGQLLQSRRNILDGGGSAEVGVSGLPSGVYLIRLISGYNQITKKWIKL